MAVAWTVEEWKDWLKLVDDQPPPQEVVANVATCLERLAPGAWAGQLNGMDADDLFAETGAVSGAASRALTRRAITTATSTAAVKRRKLEASVVATGAGASTSGAWQQQANAAGGGDASALALAAMITSGTVVDVSQLLVKAHLGKTPHLLQAEQQVWQVIQAETAAAAYWWSRMWLW